MAWKVKIWAFWPFLRDFDITKGSWRGQGNQEVAVCLLGTAWVGPFRHLPLACVFVWLSGASLRLLPTAGVCNQHLGASPRLLPTAGVCDKRLGTSLRLLLTAGVSDQHIGWFPRLLPN